MKIGDKYHTREHSRKEVEKLTNRIFPTGVYNAPGPETPARPTSELAPSLEIAT